ncbi:hypothetical protein P8452_54517 [Trifolium repens]|nr:hypothetical protein P8452_54517 [Trifolium repens]
MDLVLNYLNTATIALIALIPLFFFLFRFSKVSHTKEPPIVSGSWPLLGHLPLMKNTQTPHKTLAALVDIYGPIFTIKLGATNALVLSNCELAKECFTKNDIVVSSRPKSAARDHMSYNQAFIGWAPYGTYWRQLRKIVTLEILSSRRVELLSHIRVSEVQTSIKELVKVWSNQVSVQSTSESNLASTKDYVSVELKKWFAQLTLNMVLRMVVGKRCFGDMVDEKNKEESIRFLDNIRDFMRLIGTFTVGDAVPFLKWLDLGGHEKEMKECAKKFDILLSEWLEEHREKKVLGSNKIVEERDFLDAMLLVLNDKPIEGVSADTIIKATTLELIIAGSDSTAGTLSWAMCLLLKNPHLDYNTKGKWKQPLSKPRTKKNELQSTLSLIGTFIVGDAVPFLKRFDLGGHEKEIKECSKKFDILLSEWLEEHREKKVLGSDKVVGERDFLDAMLLVLNDKPIEGFSADTVIKATTLVRVYNILIYIS